MQLKTLEGKTESSFLYICEDSTQAFVHDTYRDFFLAKYFATEINSGRFSIQQDYIKQWCDFTSFGYPCIKGAVKKAIMFMVDMLTEDNLAGILDVCSRVYPRLMEHYVKMNDGLYDFWSIKEIGFAFEVADASRFPREKLPQEMKKWIRYCSEDYSFFFCGYHFKENVGVRTNFFSEKAQNYIFHALPKEKKQGFVEWCLNNHTLPPTEFRFDAEGSVHIIDYLSASRGIRLGYSDFYFDMLEHLENDDSTIQLWIGFLQSGKPNYDYAAYVLGKFEEARAVKPLIEALVSPDEDFAIIYCEQYNAPFLRALIRIGESALPLLEETLHSRADLREDLLHAIIGIRNNGSHKAEAVLRRSVTIAEYENLCMEYRGLRSSVEECKEVTKQTIEWLRENAGNIEKYL